MDLVSGIIVGLAFMLVGGVVYLNHKFKTNHFELLAKENKELLKHIDKLINKGLSPDWFSYVNGQKLLADEQVRINFDETLDDKKKEPEIPNQLHAEGASDTSHHTGAKK